MSDQPRPPQHEGRFTRTLNQLLIKLKVDEVPHIKRIIVTVVGGTVLIFGVILIVTPGPAVLVIPVGLAILGTEYAWARRWLRKARKIADKALTRTQRIIGSAKSRRQEKETMASSENPAAPGAGTPEKPSVGDMPAAERCEDHPEAMAGAAGPVRGHLPVDR